MQARFYRMVPITDVVAGDLVQTEKGLLNVDSITLFADHIEVAGLPPTRSEGRRVVATMPRTGEVEVVASGDLAAKLIDEITGLELRAHHTPVGLELKPVVDDLGDGWILEVEQ